MIDKALGQVIDDAFPSIAYKGQVTSVDGEKFSEEIDEDLCLYQYLWGRDWRSVDLVFINSQESGLPLLTDNAFVAFVAAWLMRSIEFPHADNGIREHVIYTLAGGATGRGKERRLLLNTSQRFAVRTFLEFTKKIEPSTSIRSDADLALKSLDRLDRALGAVVDGDQ